VSAKPEFSNNPRSKMRDWTLDDHYLNNFSRVKKDLEEIEQDWKDGDVTLSTLKSMSWVFDWVSSIQGALIDSMREGEER
jgi:hypothetical protein